MAVFNHTTVVPYSKSPEKTLETVIRNLPLMRIVHTPQYNMHSHQASWWLCLQRGSTGGVIKCPYVDSPWLQDPPAFLPVSVAVILLPLSVQLIYHWSVSLKSILFGRLCMSCEVLSGAPSVSRKAQIQLFSTASCVCVITWWIAVSMDLPGF